MGGWISSCGLTYVPTVLAEVSLPNGDASPMAAVRQLAERAINDEPWSRRCHRRARGTPTGGGSSVLPNVPLPCCRKPLPDMRRGDREQEADDHEVEHHLHHRHDAGDLPSRVNVAVAYGA